LLSGICNAAWNEVEFEIHHGKDLTTHRKHTYGNLVPLRNTISTDPV